MQQVVQFVGNVHQTPPSTTFTTLTKDPKPGHSDWLPIKLAEIIARTTIWCDVMSLGPPDGLFMDLFQEALLVVAERAKERADNAKVKAKEEGGSEEDDINPVIIRMMFGNIVGMPTNCEQVLKDLTKVIPKEYSKYIRIWVGAWRKGVSWNHAKIIAVDGKHLWTGGHNLWDQHYLKHNPVHDLSLEMKVRYVPTNVRNCCRGWLVAMKIFVVRLEKCSDILIGVGRMGLQSRTVLLIDTYCLQSVAHAW